MSENTLQADLSKLISLTESERLAARDVAKANVLRRSGEQPTREQYKHSVISDYPTWLITIAAIMLVIVFVASASISVFRLYAAGRDHFLQSIPIMWQAKTTGLSTAIMAEFLVIVAAASMTIFFKGRARLLMVAPILIGLAVAFVGNWQITQPGSLWGWLDTFAPPLAVLSTAIIGEKIILSSIRQRWENEKAYQSALADWKQQTAEPESSPHWKNSYMNALKSALQHKNAAGRGQAERQAIMQGMTTADWRALVHRELQADDWTTADQPGMPAVVLTPVAPVVVSGQHIAPQEVTTALPLASNGNGRH